MNRSNSPILSNYILLSKIPYDFYIIHDKTSFIKIKNFFNETNRYDLKIKFFYSIQNNLSSLILHSFRFPEIKLFKNRVSLKNNCDTCRFISFDNYVRLNSGFLLPVLCNGTCESRMAIYIIKFNLCNDFNVGKSEITIRKRMRVHLSMIRNDFPFKY